MFLDGKLFETFFLAIKRVDIGLILVEQCQEKSGGLQCHGRLRVIHIATSVILLMEKNPAPPGMCKTLQINGINYQL